MNLVNYNLPNSYTHTKRSYFSFTHVESLWCDVWALMVNRFVGKETQFIFGVLLVLHDPRAHISKLGNLAGCDRWMERSVV